MTLAQQIVVIINKKNCTLTPIDQCFTQQRCARLDWNFTHKLALISGWHMESDGTTTVFMPSKNSHTATDTPLLFLPSFIFATPPKPCWQPLATKTWTNNVNGGSHGSSDWAGCGVCRETASKQTHCSPLKKGEECATHAPELQVLWEVISLYKSWKHDLVFYRTQKKSPLKIYIKSVHCRVSRLKKIPHHTGNISVATLSLKQY